MCIRDRHYSYYGGRGIKVCDDWLDVKVFYAHFGEIEKPMTIERIDSNGNYDPSNCKLATPKEQANNRCNNILITHKDETRTMSEWADKTGINVNTIASRIHRGWSHDESLTRPVASKQNKPEEYR